MKDSSKSKEYEIQRSSLKKRKYDFLEQKDFIFKKAGINNGSVLEIVPGKAKQPLSENTNWKTLYKSWNELKSKGILKYVRTSMADGDSLLSFEDSSFDHVISMNNSMRLGKNQASRLKEMLRISRKNVIIAEINQEGKSILGKNCSGKDTPICRGRERKQQLRKILLDSKCRVQEFKGIHQMVFIAQKQED